VGDLAFKGPWRCHSRFRGNCHGGFPITEYENFRDFPSAAQDYLHVGGGLKSALKEKGAVFWEMTAKRFGMTAEGPF